MLNRLILLSILLLLMLSLTTTAQQKTDKFIKHNRCYFKDLLLNSERIKHYRFDIHTNNFDSIYVRNKYMSPTWVQLKKIYQDKKSEGNADITNLEIITSANCKEEEKSFFYRLFTKREKLSISRLDSYFIGDFEYRLYTIYHLNTTVQIMFKLRKGEIIRIAYAQCIM